MRSWRRGHWVYGFKMIATGILLLHVLHMLRELSGRRELTHTECSRYVNLILVDELTSWPMRR